MSEEKALQKRRIEGRVAEILNARELVINKGGDAGVRVGMKFAVLADAPLEIRDPESGEILDALDREKVRVEASEVRSRIAVCRTYRIRRLPAGPLYSVLEASGLTRPPREIPDTLAVKDASLPPPLAEEESFVKKNDRVVQVHDEDE